MKRQTVEQWDAGYVRVSTEMQVERDALRNQTQALQGYAAAHGLTLRLYKDEGISPKDTDRPDLQRLRAAPADRARVPQSLWATARPLARP